MNDESDVNKLADATELGIKKARQIKHAAGIYLEEEAKLRAELDAEKAGSAKSAGPEGRAPERTCHRCAPASAAGRRPSQPELVRAEGGDGARVVRRTARGQRGRGAWLHPRRACLARALKRRVVREGLPGRAVGARDAGALRAECDGTTAQGLGDARNVEEARARAGKQLKEHGIELSNQELVDKLHALGY